MHKPSFKEFLVYGVFSFIENKKIRNVLSGVAYGYYFVKYVQLVKELNNISK